MAHILVVEDEEQIGKLVRDQFVAAGHTVTLVTDGNSALRTLETGAADLVILDWMLPGLDGLEVCRRIRARSITPILMLTARAEEVDRVLGLEVGADDYLTKPFSMMELMARARALLRRVSLMTERAGASGEEAQRQVIEVGDLRIDVAGRAVWVAGTPVDLTPKEFELLHVLAAQPGRAYSREYLLQRVWGMEYDGFDRTVDTHIVRLRRKLGALGDRIVTVWGVGMIRIVCARRRGMLRKLSLTNRRLRRPSATTTAVMTRNMASIQAMMVFIERPKSEFMERESFLLRHMDRRRRRAGAWALPP